MNLDEFIDDLRKLKIPADFEGGNDKQRTKLNEIIDALDEILQAANRAAANAEDNTFIAWVEDGGESVQYEIWGNPVEVVA